MSKHFELICECCDVVEVNDNSIFYFDGDDGIAEVNGFVFSCHNLNEFHEIIEMYGEY